MCPGTVGLNLFTHSQQNTGRYNKQTRMMDTNVLTKIIKNKTWQVNAQLIDNLKYLHAKHIIHKSRMHKPAKLTNPTNHCGASSLTPN